jgi:hypothetical protein
MAMGSPARIFASTLPRVESWAGKDERKPTLTHSIVTVAIAQPALSENVSPAWLYPLDL